MLFVNTILLIISVFTANALAAKSCRQCSGTIGATFKDFALKDEATAWVKGRIGNCAGGDKIDILGYSNPLQDCNAAQKCKSWKIDVKVWRYCGNGGTVDVYKTNQCVFKTCSVNDRLQMTCHPSVECKSLCDLPC